MSYETQTEGQMKKVGYKHAIEHLFNEYERLVKVNPEDEKTKSIKEGIEYLCFPFREDLTSDQIPISPLQDEENPMTIVNLDSFSAEEIEEHSRRYIENNIAANNILIKLCKI